MRYNYYLRVEEIGTKALPPMEVALACVGEASFPHEAAVRSFFWVPKPLWSWRSGASPTGFPMKRLVRGSGLPHPTRPPGRQ